MASGAGPANLIFPSGIDSFSTKVDRNQTISSEAHVIPNSPGPYTLFLNYVPLLANPSTLSIPGYVEISGTPANLQYDVTYSGTNAGLLTFNSAQSGASVNISYKTYGDILEAEYINSLQSGLANVETFVLANIASGSYVAVSGGSMNGTLILNSGVTLASGVIETSVSGIGNIGVNGTPFGQLFVDEIQTSYVHSASPLTVSALNGDLTLSGVTIYVGADVVPSTSGVFNLGSVSSAFNTIFADAIGSTILMYSGANILNAAPSVNDLGSSSMPFANIYVDNLISTNLPSGLVGFFVQNAGDTMTGNLVILSGSHVDAFEITNTNSDLLLNSVGNILVNRDTIPNYSGIINLGSASAPYDTIYVKTVDGATLTGNFVIKTGDSMSGDLTLPVGTSLNVNNINSSNLSSGTIHINASQLNVDAQANIKFSIFSVQMFEIATNGLYVSASVIPTISGTYNLGEFTRPYDSVYANNLRFGTISSGVDILGARFVGDAVLASGSNIVPEISGGATLGSSSLPFGAIYAESVITNAGSGTYLSKYGDTLVGNYVPSASGLWSLGTPATPLSGVYANNLNANFVHKSGDVMTGSLSVPELYNSGTLIVSGNSLELYGQQVQAQSLNGPIILDANTEVQLLVNGSTKITTTLSGNLSFDNFYPNISGSYSLGMANKPWGTIYTDSIVTSLGTSGIFVSKFGDTMTGVLQMTSGANIITSISGVNDIGQNGTPWNNLYVDNINGYPFNTVVSGAFVRASGDTMTGDLTMGNQASIIVGDNNTEVSAGNNVLIGDFNGVSGTTNNSIIIGGMNNANNAKESIIGGYANTVSTSQSFVMGSTNTVTSAQFSLTIGHGNSNLAYGAFVGGEFNTNNPVSNTSFMYGYSGTTTGKSSINVGTQNTNQGSSSATFGYKNTVVADTGFAAGGLNNVVGIGATSFGLSGNNTGNYSFIAGGFGNSVLNHHSFAAGVFNTVLGIESAAIGGANTVTATYGVGLGKLNLVNGTGTFAAGYQNVINTGSGGVALGAFNVNNADFTATLGYSNTANGFGAMALGYTNTASSQYTYAVGFNNIVTASYSTAFGYNNSTNGTNASAFGDSNTAQADSASAFGRSNNALGTYSTAVGYANNAVGSGTTVIGNTITGFNNNTLYLGAPSGIIIQSGKNLVPEVSGIQNLGSPNKTFDTVYTNNLSVGGMNFPRFKFNEVPSGLINSSNKNYTLSNTPLSGSSQIFYNGTYMIPSGVGAPLFDYVLSGSTISFTTPPVSGATLIAAQYTY